MPPTALTVDSRRGAFICYFEEVKADSRASPVPAETPASRPVCAGEAARQIVLVRRMTKELYIMAVSRRIGGNGDGDDAGDIKGGQGDTVVERRTQTKTKLPPMYKVILLNDDYTPMEFVV